MKQAWLSDVLVMAAMGAATSVFAPALFLALRPVVPASWLRAPAGLALGVFVVWHALVTISMPPEMGHAAVILLWVLLLAGSLLFWAPLLREERRLTPAGRTLYLFLGCPLLDMAAVYPISIGDAPGGVAMIAGMMPITVFGAWSLLSWARAEEREVQRQERTGAAPWLGAPGPDGTVAAYPWYRPAAAACAPVLTVAQATPPARAGVAHSLARWRVAEILLALLWLLDGFLQLQPRLFMASMLRPVLLPAHPGGDWPSVIAAPGLRLALSHWPVVNAAIGIGQLAIGAAVLSERLASPALAASTFWAGAVWLWGEHIGGLGAAHPSPLTGAPGAALVYGALGAALLWRRRSPLQAQLGRAVGHIWSWLWLAIFALTLLPGSWPGRWLEMQGHRSAIGMPGWMAHAGAAVGGWAVSHSILATLVPALLALAVAAAGRSRAGLLAGCALAFAYGWVGQGFGGIFGPGATDPAMAPIVVILAVAAWPSGRLATSPAATGEPLGPGAARGAASGAGVEIDLREPRPVGVDN